jgi:bifunctional enzyme CysN/CysC
MESKDLALVIAGHVDHGKSTVMGRLLAEMGALPQGRLEEIREYCRRHSRPFEYAFLLDALKDERAQGITIDSARIHFRTPQRNVLVLDAPGHIELLKNMVTGASQADAALLVIDASEGVQENSRRHGTLLSLLGIRQVAVLVNKMDLASYQRDRYESICTEYEQFLHQIEIDPKAMIPVSAREGDNLIASSARMPWYRGPSVIEAVDAFHPLPLPVDKPFRMPVQGIYKFTRDGDNRRIIAGTVESGKIMEGDTVVFYPSGKKSAIRSFESFNSPQPAVVSAGMAAGFTLREQVYIRRGEVAVRVDESPPHVASRFVVNLFWLGKAPLSKGKEYLFKSGTAKIPVHLEEVQSVLNAASLATVKKDMVERHDVAECVLETKIPLALDCWTELSETSRFVIVDAYEIAGGGRVIQVLSDTQAAVREKVLRRNLKWERGIISPEERQEKYRQKACLVLITGIKDAGKKPVARILEKRLFEEGRLVYFLGIGNVLYGVDSDIKSTASDTRAEHLRRLAEVAHLILDAGAILIVTAIELCQADLETLRTILDLEDMEVFWVGNRVTTDISFNRQFDKGYAPDQAAEEIKELLAQKRVIF